MGEPAPQTSLGTAPFSNRFSLGLLVLVATDHLPHFMVWILRILKNEIVLIVFGHHLSFWNYMKLCTYKGFLFCVRNLVATIMDILPHPPFHQAD